MLGSVVFDALETSYFFETWQLRSIFMQSWSCFWVFFYHLSNEKKRFLALAC